MTLRNRLLLLFLPLLALILLGIWQLSEHILLARFDRDDRQRLYDEVRVLDNRLAFEKKRHLDLLRSYAWWDASYRFVAHPTPGFVRENLDIDMLGNLGFDFALYLDRQGRVVAQRWEEARLAAPQAITGAPSPERLRQALLRSALDLGVLDLQGDPSRSLAQWLLVDGTPLLLLSQPISDNLGQAEPVGAIVAGYLLDQRRVNALQEQMDARLQVQAGVTPGDGWRALHVPGRNGGALLSPRRVLDADTQQATLLFLDSADAPQFSLAINKSRVAYRQGQEAIRLFLGMTLLITLAGLLLAYLVLEFWVIRRVQRLNRGVANIGADTAGPARLADMGRDEVGQLACEVNQMLERLERSEARDRAILDSIRDGYFEMDDSGVVLTVNAAFCRLLGYAAEEVEGHSYRELLDEQDVARARGLYQQVRDGEQETTFAAPFKRRDGQRMVFETKVSPIVDAQGQFCGFRGILRDISLQVAYQQRLLDLAYRDALTGLGNRKAFGEQLPLALQRCAEGTGLALLYIDLDHFKPVNDRYGHAAGDAVLVAVGERLRNNLRQPDMAFRLGGDEFAVILEGVDCSTAEALAGRLLASLNQDYHAGEQRLEFLSASIGIALYPADAGDTDGLLQAADSAMYRAKQQRNHYSRYRA